MAVPPAGIGIRAGQRVLVLRTLLLVAICVELTFALVARGGFFPPNSTIVLVWSLIVLSCSYALGSARPSIRTEEVCLLILAAWWLVAARLHGMGDNFEPMGAAIVSFVAAAVVFRKSAWHWRRRGALFGIVLCTITAIAGIIACDLRWYPFTMRGQDLWRLSGSVTYSNATGLLLGMALLLSMDRMLQTRWTSFAIAACTAGLIATQSRSAVLASVIAIVWLARRECQAAVVPLLIGTFAGLVTVASSSGHAGRPLALCVSLVALALVPLLSHVARRRAEGWSASRRREATVAVVAIGAAVLLGAVIAARSEAEKRFDLGSDLGRFREWRAALSQFHVSIWTGIGPDRRLTISATSGTSTYFAHNEYLQFLAGGGLIALGLLVTAAIFIVRRRRMPPRSVHTACGALVVFAVGGLFDYSWHVPAIALFAGMILGLAQPDAETPTAMTELEREVPDNEAQPAETPRPF